MDVRVRRPSVPEQTPCEAEEGRNDRDWEASFRDRNVIILEGGAVVVGVLE